jgi:hypothetical protein
LTKKDVNFIWTDECQQAFQALKIYLTSDEHVLILPDYNESFRLECDASSHGIGGVLSQKEDVIFNRLLTFPNIFRIQSATIQHRNESYYQLCFQ